MWRLAITKKGLCLCKCVHLCLHYKCTIMFCGHKACTMNTCCGSSEHCDRCSELISTSMSKAGCSNPLTPPMHIITKHLNYTTHKLTFANLSSHRLYYIHEKLVHSSFSTAGWHANCKPNQCWFNPVST